LLNLLKAINGEIYFTQPKLLQKIFIYLRCIFSKNYRTYVKFSYQCSSEILKLMSTASEEDNEYIDNYDNLFIQMKLICYVEGWVLVNLHNEDKENINKGPIEYFDLITKSWQRCLNIYLETNNSLYVPNWFMHERVVNENKNVNDAVFWSADYFYKIRDNKLLNYQIKEFCLKAFSYEEKLNLEKDYEKLLSIIKNDNIVKT